MRRSFARFVDLHRIHALLPCAELSSLNKAKANLETVGEFTKGNHFRVRSELGNQSIVIPEEFAFFVHERLYPDREELQIPATKKLIAKIDCFIAPSAETPKTPREYLEEIFRDPHTPIDEPADLQTWASFCKDYPVWQDPGKSFVLWRDHPNLQGANITIPLQRAQRGRNCFLHAPLMHVHYLISLSSGKQVGVEDVSSFYRLRAAPGDLRERLERDAGGHAQAELDSMTGITSHQLSGRQLESTTTTIEKAMLDHGPLLLSSFKPMDQFRRLVCSHLQDFNVPPVAQTAAGRHAMVVVGFREAADGSAILLLQNWTRQKQFVEISAKNVNISGGELFLTPRPVADFPHGAEVSVHRYNEGLYLDAAEVLLEGRSQ